MRTPLGGRRFRSQGSPIPICSIRECGRNWVSTTIRYSSELTALERGKSMIRYLPPKGTAGLARFSPRILNRLPAPPARIRVNTFIRPPRSQVVIEIVLGAHPPPDDEDVRGHSRGVQLHIVARIMPKVASIG